ncbi:MAG: ribosome small subunit-dependent GTPase A [Lentisphaerota bacterium]
MKLETIGWTPAWAESFERVTQPAWIPGRIIREGKLIYLVQTGEGALLGEVSGRYHHLVKARSDFPVVGDWVAVQALPNERRATIHALLPRQSCFSRKAPGETTEEQILAANVDIAFLVSGLDGGRNLNIRRIERFLPLASESGAQTVVLLNKSDLCNQEAEKLNEVASAFPEVPVHATSAMSKIGLEHIAHYVFEGRTAVLLGPSGVGKSALINALIDQAGQTVGEVREKDKRGRHTTTRRELFILPTGGCIIDTPGLREIQLWADGDAVNDSFEDILSLSAQCRFRDCRHENEPGCAVQQAIAEGQLDLQRYESYQQLRKEVAFLERKKDVRARINHESKWKQIARMQRQKKVFENKDRM